MNIENIARKVWKDQLVTLRHNPKTGYDDLHIGGRHVTGFSPEWTNGVISLVGVKDAPLLIEAALTKVKQEIGRTAIPGRLWEIMVGVNDKGKVNWNVRKL